MLVAEIWPDRAGDWRPIARQTGRAVVAAALVGLVIALAATIAPRVFGFESLAVTTGSMGSAAPRGGLLVARSKPASAVKPGDVIVMERPGRSTVVHRVLSVGMTPSGYAATTGGDANPTPDPEPYPLPPQVLTKSYVLPYLGYLVSLLALPVGWLLLIALPATAVGLSIIRDFWADGDAADAKQAPAAVPAQAPAVPAPAAAEPRASTQADVVLTELQTTLAAVLEELADVRNRLSRAEAALESQAARQAEPPVPGEEPQPPTEPREQPAHLLFVPTAERYVLLEVPGAPPQPGGVLAADDGRRFVVSKVGRSPLPDDDRRCAYLQAA